MMWGGKTAETDTKPNGTVSHSVSQPASRRQRSSEHDNNKKKVLERKGKTRTPRWETKALVCPALWRRDLLQRQPRGTEIPYLIWRVSPASTSHPLIPPSTHPPLTNFSGVAHIGEEKGGRQPTNWPVPTPSPPHPSPEREREEKKKTHPPQAPTVQQANPPTHRVVSPRKQKKRGCGIARQQTDKGEWGALEPRKPLVPCLGVAAATFRNPFGGFLAE